MKFLIALLALSFGSSAFANYDLSQNGKKIYCPMEDNASLQVNAKRTYMKFMVEGESLGFVKITKVETDGATFVTYHSEIGIATFSNQGDTFQFDGDSEAGTIDCE